MHTNRTLYNRMKRLLSMILIVIVTVVSVTACDKEKSVTDLMGSYAASDSIVNDDVGAMMSATFSPLLSEWFICDITEDMLNTSYVFDEENEKKKGAAYVINRTDNELVFGYNMLSKMYPASITKLLTTLVVLENCDVKEPVTIDETVAAMKRGSVAELNEGDVISIYNLLIVLLTISANNAAVALARHVAGSEEAFAEMMNAEMNKLGNHSSSFKNCSGLHLNEHYTTPYDMYIVFQECMKYDSFRSIMKLIEGEYEYTNAAGEQCVRKYKTTNCFKNGLYEYPENITILGGKTGTTDSAGYCIMLLVQSDTGTEYIIGIYNCATEEKLYTKAAELMTQYCK